MKLIFRSLFSTTLIVHVALPQAFAQTKVPKGVKPPVSSETAQPARNLPMLKLSPQTVVDLALSKGNRARAAELQAQRGYLPLAQALGAYDFQLSLATGWEYSEAESLTGLSNPSDRTFTVTSLLSKKFSTGTTVSLGYQDTRQNSTLNTVTSTTRPPTANLNEVELGVRQALLSNSFGYADRLAVEVGESTIVAALETREEQLEEILLSSMVLYWNAYIAEQQLKENMAARDKYEQLVRNVRRRAGFNLSTPGELPRIEAEYEIAEQRVKASTADYMNAIDALLTAIKADAPEGGVTLEIPSELPPMPRLTSKTVEDLRVVRVARINQENSQKSLEAVKSRSRPRLDFVARAAATGVDEESGRAIAEMAATTHPTYFIGLEFQTALDSTALRGTLANAEVEARLAEVNLRIQRDDVTDQLEQLERRVASQHSVAQLANETVTLRERVVREFENNYRLGRQPLVELIRAYNELFSSQLERARAVGQYHIGLNQLAAARDELVTKVSGRGEAAR